MPTTIVKIGLNPLDDNIAHATSTTAMVDPTERSIPAVIIAIVIPIARNAFTVPCCIISIKLSYSIYLAFNKENMRITSTNATAVVISLLLFFVNRDNASFISQTPPSHVQE